MKKTIGMAALCAALLCGFTACDEEHYSELPAFGGFRMEPSEWHSGDKATVTAVQQQLGNLLYKAKYIWHVECSGVTLADTTYSVVYDTDKADPAVTFRIPADVQGTASVSFRAEYSYSARSPKSVSNGTNDGHSGLQGSIRATGSGELSGICAGSTSCTIKARSEE